MSKKDNTYKFNITGMSCAACQARVERVSAKCSGVESATVSLLTNSMQVAGDINPQEIVDAVVNAGYGAKYIDESKANDASVNESDKEIKNTKKRLFTSLALLIPLMYITMGHNMAHLPVPSFLHNNFIGLATVQLVLSLTIIIINRKFFVNGFRGLVKLSPNMDSLIALGSGISFVYSIYIFAKIAYTILNKIDGINVGSLYHNQLYFESAAMILVIITIGKLLEAISKGKTTNALKSLNKLKPTKATIIKDDKQIEIDISRLQIGDTFIVKKGESIPADGIITEGYTTIDESMLTGESIPVEKRAGDEVNEATINKEGVIICKATKVGGDTLLSQIIDMVMDSSATKAPIARIADKVSYVFVPVIIGLSVITFISWLLINGVFNNALTHAISVLVISCPCALGLATPVAIMVGNGVGARNGILYKTSEALENTGKIKQIAFDKTGTITNGTPVVTSVCTFENANENEILSYAFSLEQNSNHPLATAICDFAKEKNIQAKQVSEFEERPGNGLSGVIDNEKVYVGNVNFIKEALNITDLHLETIDKFTSKGQTCVLVAKGDMLLGNVAIADTIKEDATISIEHLNKIDIGTIMLTGDNENVARTIAKEVGIQEVKAGVLPMQKSEVIKELKTNGTTCMVGDGINDSVALTEADIGMSMGKGSDIASNSADIILLNSNLKDVVKAILISKRTIKVIHENLFWAFFYNMICIPVAAGLTPITLNPMIAATAMSLSSITVCLNSLRLNAKGTAL